MDDNNMIAVSNMSNAYDMAWLADWYTRKMGELEANRKAIKAMSKEMLDGIDREEARIRDSHEAELRQEIDRQFADTNGKKKTLKNMFGEISYRTVPARDKISVVDEDKTIEWAIENNPDLVKKVLDKTALTCYIKETGEDVPGVEVSRVESYQSFLVKPYLKKLESK